MASSLAHELSQPLTAAATYIGACRRLLAAPDADRALIAEAIDKAERQTRRAGEVLAGLRDFLYRGETHLAPLPFGAIIDSVVALAAPEAERLAVTLVRRDGAGDARVLVDRIQIEQALLNLVRNGMEAIVESGGGERRIEIGSRADAASVEGWVADTGAGVPPEIAERLFHPFVTTKEHGMGLGLTITRSIFEAHGGALVVRAGRGAGQRVPLHPAARRRCLRRHPSIYVVDDDEAVRELAVAVVRVRGFDGASLRLGRARSSTGSTRVGPAASWPTCACRACRASSFWRSCRPRRRRSRSS